MRPICASAHFTGSDSLHKQLACKSLSACRALRRGAVPASAALTISDIARGATLAVTEITPRAPAPSSRTQ